MPISQDRVLRLLNEFQSLRSYCVQLQEDLLDVLSSDLSTALKLEAITALAGEELPVCAWLEVEQEHFRRAASRNVKSRERMRRSRNSNQEGRASDV